MVRKIFGPLGAVMVLAPKRVLNFFEKAALDNPDEATPKPWIIPAIRIEGIVYALLALIGGKAYGKLMEVVGAVGVIVFLIPKKYLRFGTKVAYEEPDNVVWKDQFVSLVRVFGGILVLLAVSEKRKRRQRGSVGNGDDE